MFIWLLYGYLPEWTNAEGWQTKPVIPEAFESAEQCLLAREQFKQKLKYLRGSYVECHKTEVKDKTKENKQ